jgi:hypothetical protein
MATKYPNISHHKPYSEETVQCNLKPLYKSPNPTTHQFNVSCLPLTFSYKSSITMNRLGIPPDQKAPRRETANASETMSLQASIFIVAKSTTGTTA